MRYTYIIVSAQGKELVALYADKEDDKLAKEWFDSEAGGLPEGAKLYAVLETYRQVHPKSTATWEPKSLVIKDA